MKKIFSSCVLSALVATASFATSSFAASSLDGKAAPTFVLNNQDGKSFNLAERKDKGFTVLYFYPKAGTPGCTKQACAFRDSINQITKLGAAVYGISIDTVADQKKFHTEHKMTFDLLSDADGKVADLYQVRTPGGSYAKRETFIMDKTLKIIKHYQDVDPVLDAKNVAAFIASKK